MDAVTKKFNRIMLYLAAGLLTLAVAVGIAWGQEARPAPPPSALLGTWISSQGRMHWIVTFGTDSLMTGEVEGLADGGTVGWQTKYWTYETPHQICWWGESIQCAHYEVGAGVLRVGTRTYTRVSPCHTSACT